MKKKSLVEEPKEVSKKVSWNKFKDMKISDLKRILEIHGKVLVFTIEGDFFELTELDL